MEIPRKSQTGSSRWLEAFRAIRRLIANPDDTAQVFRVIRAFSDRSLNRQFERFRATPQGRRILAGESTLLERLSDRVALERLPQGGEEDTQAPTKPVDKATTRKHRRQAGRPAIVQVTGGAVVGDQCQVGVVEEVDEGAADGAAGAEQDVVGLVDQDREEVDGLRHAGHGT